MAALTDQKKALVEKWRQEGIPSDLLAAFSNVPREEFMSEGFEDQAYEDRPFPIGHEQTISQPTTVMKMLQLLSLKPKMKVLEIGSGSGYVCALLAELGCTVTGVDIVPELVVHASKVISDLGYDDRVSLYASDAGEGWEQDAPYDRILISCAVPTVPRELYHQLKDSGVLLAPVGTVEQQMTTCRKKKSGEVEEKEHGTYIFVPLTGKKGLEDGGVPGMPLV